MSQLIYITCLTTVPSFEDVISRCRTKCSLKLLGFFFFFSSLSKIFARKEQHFLIFSASWHCLSVVFRRQHERENVCVHVLLLTCMSSGDPPACFQIGREFKVALNKVDLKCEVSYSFYCARIVFLSG